MQEDISRRMVTKQADLPIARECPPEPPWINFHQRLFIHHDENTEHQCIQKDFAKWYQPVFGYPTSGTISS